MEKIIFEGNQYFEGTFQLRDPTDEVMRFVEKNLKGVSKVVKIRNGVDYYVCSQKHLRSFGKKLNENFSGVMKSSRKLFTRNRQTSKEVYRVTVMFRCVGIKKGDTVNFKGEDMEVLAVSKKALLKRGDGKKFNVSLEEISPSYSR